MPDCSPPGLLWEVRRSTVHGLSSYPTGTAILQPLLAWLLSKGGCLTYSTKREGRKEGREGERKPGRKGRRERKAK